MGDTAARLLALLSLLQAPREWPGSELAARLEVSGRTIRRDVDRLRALGYPVVATAGAIGGYRLIGGTAMPPLLLDDEEAVAIAVGLRTLVAHAIQGGEDASLRALAKLQQVLPPRLGARVAALASATGSLPMAGPCVDPEALTQLARCIANGERVRFDYASADGTSTRRLVEPHGLVTAGRRWYLVAWDVDRADWRTFRVDRISDSRPLPGRVARRVLPAPDAASFVLAQRDELAPTQAAVATVRMPASDVRRRLSDGYGEVEAIDAATSRLSLHADTIEWLAFRLILLGAEFEVLEPPALAEYLVGLGERLREPPISRDPGSPSFAARGPGRRRRR